MRAAALWLIPVFAVVACNQSTAPSPVTTHSAPASGPTGGPAIPTGPYSLTGIVTERSARGDHHVAGVNVNAFIQTATHGYSYMWAHGARLTDAQGRFELTNLPEGATLQFQVYKPGYVQQCASPRLLVNGNLQLNAQIVASANVSASRESVPPSAPGNRMIFGVVYEVTSEGRRPAPGAFVDYEAVPDSPAAVTYTDTQGRFLLCGIPQERSATIGASIGSGRFNYALVPPGSDASVDIEIR